jgi:hypothetical protein
VRPPPPLGSHADRRCKGVLRPALADSSTSTPLGARRPKGPEIRLELLSEAVGGLGGAELADAVVQRGEVDRVAGLAGRDSQRDRDVGLAGARWSEQRDVARTAGAALGQEGMDAGGDQLTDAAPASAGCCWSPSSVGGGGGQSPVRMS